MNEASPFEKPRFLRLWTGMGYLGVGNQLTLKLDGGGRVVALEHATYRMRSDDRWKIGQKVRLGWHAEHRVVLSSNGASA